MGMAAGMLKNSPMGLLARGKGDKALKTLGAVSPAASLVGRVLEKKPQTLIGGANAPR